MSEGAGGTAGGGWLRAVARLAAAVEQGVDIAKDAVGQRIGETRAARIVPYRGYGTPERIWVTGRVLRDHPLPASRQDASIWENALSTFRRFESDEVPRAIVRLTAGDAECTVAADDEGYFSGTLPALGSTPLTEGWHAVEGTLLHPRDEGTPASPTLLSARVVLPDAQFGVISDIDDTVVKTGATELLTMARTVFLGNARTRTPFEGVAELYAALVAGDTGARQNPLFYVSSSPWNFYELLVEFLELQKIPLGPLMLRDWGVSAEELLPVGHAGHKRKAIDGILTTFPTLPFLLVGDSGQEDPEIYASVIREFPDRIMGAYIRNVHPDPLRATAVRTLAEELGKTGGVLLLADDSATVLADARKRGWVK
jgi:phosphatidate phosphatase APP1